MANDDIEKLFVSLKRFKQENSTVLNEWQRFIVEVRTKLFALTCLKPHLNECEPEYCAYRQGGECQYPNQLTRLKEIVEGK